MRLLNYWLLLLVKVLARLFYRVEVGWVGSPKEDPWSAARLVAILNHTSLYEPLFAGAVPNRFLKRIARHAVVPVADKTLQRPLVGRFFRLLIPEVVLVTRKRDHTWEQLSQRIGPDSLVIILPEGRMKRANGLDKDGHPMTVRGGIADLLKATPSGSMLLAYSGGLHHVQAPGELLPRLFKTIRMNFELIDISTYRSALLEIHGRHGFKKAVVEDMEHRRNEHCPPPTPR